MPPIVIAGTGLAGYTVAREFRKLDKSTPFVMVTRDAGGFYSKPNLSNALAQKRTPEALVTASPEKMAADLGIEVRTGVLIASIDVARSEVATSEGPIAYSQLVLALGADPIRLPLAGDGAEEVHSVNDVADYAGFRARLEGARSVAVIGAGLIGCEFANDLLAAGYVVSVIDLAPLPLGRLLPPHAGEYVRERLAEAGVRWHLGATPTSVSKCGRGYRVDLADGQTIQADVVLSAVGLRPRTGLAEAAGIPVNRGIVTDRYLRTGAHRVFALGDCAEVDGLVLPYVMPVMQAARALAKTLAGDPTPVTYPAMPVVVKTPAVPTVVSPALPHAAGTWQVDSSPDGVRARLVGPDGTLFGFALAGTACTERQSLAKQVPAWLDGAAEKAAA